MANETVVRQSSEWRRFPRDFATTDTGTQLPTWRERDREREREERRACNASLRGLSRADCTQQVLISIGDYRPINSFWDQVERTPRSLPPPFLSPLASIGRVVPLRDLARPRGRSRTRPHALISMSKFQYRFIIAQAGEPCRPARQSTSHNCVAPNFRSLSVGSRATGIFCFRWPTRRIRSDNARGSAPTRTRVTIGIDINCIRLHQRNEYSSLFRFISGVMRMSSRKPWDDLYRVFSLRKMRVVVLDIGHSSFNSDRHSEIWILSNLR